MTNPTEWNPERVIMQETNKSDKLQSPQLLFNKAKNEYEYDSIHVDDTMLHEFEPSLINHMERAVSKITVSEKSTSDNTPDVPSRCTFVSTERHRTITSESTIHNRAKSVEL